MKKRMALTALGLGAAYLMRNKDSRDKLSKQLDSLSGAPTRGNTKNAYSETRGPQSTGRRKGLLQSIFS
jgi:hypothetical protein